MHSPQHRHQSPWAFLLLERCQEPNTRPPPPSPSLPSRRKIPFKRVIFATTQHRVLDFRHQQRRPSDPCSKLTTAAQTATTNARAAGFVLHPRQRGWQSHGVVRQSRLETPASPPTPRSPPLVTPDNRLSDIGNPWATPVLSGIENLQRRHRQRTTQRSFWYSPSEPQRVTRDALHLLLAYELDRTGTKRPDHLPPTRKPSPCRTSKWT